MAYISGNGSNNVLVGTSTDDDIWGFQGDDVLIGSGGNDTLNGGTGADTMDGGIGNDTYVVDNVNDQVVEYENKGDDWIRASVTYSLNNAQNVENLQLTNSDDINGYGNGLDNKIYGNSGDNELFGYNGDDYLSGGGGDDYLSGGTGNDTMIGGIGDDHFVVGSVGDVVTENAGQGIDTVSSSITYSLGANVENLVLTGVSSTHGYGNELNNEITGNSGTNYLYGGAGADIMRGGAGSDQYGVDQQGDEVIEFAGEGIDTVNSTISYTLGFNLENLLLYGAANLNGYGNSLDNSIYGNDGNNVLYGYGGNDNLGGYLGADTMYGGIGNDFYSVESSGDLVIELANQGIDSVVTFGDISYTLPDNVENLYLDLMGHNNDATGNALNNFIVGSIYDNTLDGGLGQDSMQGYTGDDSYYVDNMFDVALESANEGFDVVFSTVNFTLGSNFEILSLAIGNAVSGTGNAQSNTIFGNASDNVLNGGGSSDSLSGLGGNDTFVFQAGQAGGDVVYEFEGNGAGIGDVLQFVGYGTLAQGATFAQQTATEWFISSADGLIQEVITLVGGPTVHATDFVFV